MGLRREYAQAEAEMLALAEAERHSSTAAWALYQATLAARARGDRTAETAHRASLLTGYAAHPMALRVDNATAATPPARPGADCGPRALLAVCQEAGKPATLAELTRLCATDARGTTVERVVAAAKGQGFQASPVQVDAWFLRRHRPAGLAWVNGDHYVAFFPGRDPNSVRVVDANAPAPRTEPVERLVRRSQGVVILLAWGERSLPRVTGKTSS